MGWRRSPRARRWCRPSWRCWRARASEASDRVERSRASPGGVHRGRVWEPSQGSLMTTADADIAIIGAGVMGLALAHNLAADRKGPAANRIVVIDGHYLAWGASGRNGGGVRQQWSTEMNVRLMQESMDICAHFAKRMRINVWMRRGGYLFLARTQAAARRLERNVAVQTRCGLPTQMIAPEEAEALVPELAGGERAVAACYNPSDGIVFPW